MTTKELKLVAAKARKLCVEAVYTAASGHPGGSLSATDLMTALYFSKMRIDPANPKWEDRDRFVLSKGHCAPALYGVLALRGFFPVEDVKTFRSIDGHMSGHAEMRKINGIDMSTGSLGQGISAAVGMAMAGKLDKKDYRVYAIMGDGEIEEGQVWEAVMAANKYKLDNLCAFVDVNGLQIDGPTSVVMPTEPLDEKFAAFGWNVIKIDGHNYDEILSALDAAEACKGKPTMILAKTTKGKGVSFMENSVSWHGKAPNADEYEIAVRDLDKIISELEEN
ncbi:MAG: transketolase [Ruminococcaceae bacterium]|nr:transketolase [Oscillospiraceae bacterium]